MAEFDKKLNDVKTSFSPEDKPSEGAEYHEDKKLDDINSNNYKRRDDLYSDLLDNYIASYKSKTARNKVYKLIFYIVTMFSFVALIGGAVTALIIAACSDAEIGGKITIAVGSIATVLSTIIVLPKIIAVHLFPTCEDKDMIELVKNMQENDSSIRSYFNNKSK